MVVGPIFTFTWSLVQYLLFLFKFGSIDQPNIYFIYNVNSSIHNYKTKTQSKSKSRKEKQNRNKESDRTRQHKKPIKTQNSIVR